LRVSSREEQITLFVNDTLLAEVTNPFPAPADATPAEWDMWLINNNAYSDKVARVAADHLRIWKLPPPPAEPGRRLHVAETFDDASKGPTAKSADREYGRKDGQWQLVEFANTGSRGGGHPIGGPPLYDLESEIRFRHSGGRPMLWFRALRGKDESRRLELALPDKPGQPWTLKRWVSASADGKRKEHSKVVAQGPADAPPVIHENEWNVVKIRALGPEITITVNGRLLTEFRDEPLPPGFLPHRTALEVVFVRSDEKVEGRMAVDHLYVWKLGESQP
jgi:hypothetical protein